VNVEFVRIAAIHCVKIVDFVPGTAQLVIVNVQIPGIMKRMMINEQLVL